MKTPYSLGLPLDDKAWAEVKLRAMFDCCKWDIQSEDHCVLCDFPLLFPREEWGRLGAMAERLSAEAINAEAEILRRPILQDVLGLPKAIRRTLRDFEGPASMSARVMRFDFHYAEEGWRISEVNADVPGGFNEGSGFTQIMREYYPGTEVPPDIADLYVRAVMARCRPRPTVAMIHATAYMDDRQVMEYLGRRISALGGRALPCAPEHLEIDSDEVWLRTKYGESRIEAAIRFFPADWLPNLGETKRWKAYFTNTKFCVSNPATSIVIQSKRFPLLWNQLDAPLETWRSLLPETRKVNEVSTGDPGWVWKPAFGRVGEDVGIAGVSEGKELNRIKRDALRDPEHWIVQRRFHAVPVERDRKPYYVTIGVYTVDGHAAGAYARICEKELINHEARDIAVLIIEGGSE